ncbi:MAG: hypothetical protein ACOY0T_18375 [Myxococcota bacterium]
MDRVRKILSWLARHAAEISFVVLGALLTAWIASDAFTSRVVTLSQGADYWEHSATLRALIDHPFSPQNPHFANAVPSPRFVPLFILAALVARGLNLGALDAMGIVATLNTLLLLAGIFAFFRCYFRDARASLVALVVMFASWYDAWHFSNVYQLKIFFSTAPYPSTSALGLSLLGFSLTLHILRGALPRAGVPLLSVCWAVVTITHPLTATLGFAGAVLLALTEPGVPWRLRLKVAASVPLGLLLSFAWPYFSMRRVLVGGSHDQVEGIARSLAGVADESGGKLHQFYRQRELLHTLGIAAAGVPICLYLLIRRQRLFIPLGALAMAFPFVVNAYVPLPLGHRFILLAIFYLQTAVVWLLMKLMPVAPDAWSFVNHRYVRWLSYALTSALLCFIAHLNIQAALGRLNYSARRLRGAEESPFVRYAQRVAELAGPNAIILSDAQSSWPIPTFGPKVLVLFHNNPLVTDDGERIIHVAHFLNPSASDYDRRETLGKYGVTHIVLKRNQARRIEPFLAQTAARVQLPAGYTLYVVPPELRVP